MIALLWHTNQPVPAKFRAAGGGRTVANPLSRAHTMRVSAAEDSRTAQVSRRIAPGDGYVSSRSTCTDLPKNSFSLERDAAMPKTSRATPCRQAQEASVGGQAAPKISAPCDSIAACHASRTYMGPSLYLNISIGLNVKRVSAERLEEDMT